MTPLAATIVEPALGHSTETLTRRLANAFRANNLERVGELAPAAGCLIPILMGLGLDDRCASIVEKIPLRGEHYDVTMLRNTLVSLGIGSTPHTFIGALRDDRELPCLVETPGGGLQVVLKATANGYLVYNATKNQFSADAALPTSGTLISFHDCSDQKLTLPAPGESWWPKLFERFRSMAWLLGKLTFFVNLLAVAPPLFVMLIYDEVVAAQNREMLPYLVVGLGIILVVEFGLRWYRSTALAWLAARLDILVSVQTFKQLLRLPPSRTDSATVWTQLSLMRRFDPIRDFLSGTNAGLLLDIPFVLMGTVLIALLAGPLALIPLTMIVGYGVLAWIGSNRIAGRHPESVEAESTARGMLMDTLGATVDIRRLGLRELWVDRFTKQSSNALGARLRDARREISNDAVSGVLGTAGAVVVLGWGAHLVILGEVSVGALVGVMILMWRMIGPLQGLIGILARWPMMRAALESIDRLMKMEPEQRSMSARYLHHTFLGGLELQGVSFRYNAGANAVFAGLSARIEPGQIVAVTGASGTGKSTLLKMLCGLYRPQSGLVMVDGVNLSQLDAPSLRGTISYLPHDATLFAGTIADNIRFSHPVATDEAVRAISDEVGILGQIEELPDGFNSMVDSSVPSSLVYGICLARTLIRNSSIVLLDEPGAQLDFRSDQRLLKTLARRRGKQTILITTHRPDHIAIADQVVELTGGLPVVARPSPHGTRA